MILILKRNFYSRNTLDVAKSLLGQVLCRRLDDGNVIRGIIVETEAYMENDPACHAYNGPTRRSKILFEKPGTAYIYFTYGMYHMLNLVTDKKEYGAGVLIRAIEPLCLIPDTNGPGKLCRSLEITRDLNGIDVTTDKNAIWVEKGEEIPEENIVQTTRIGIKHGKELPWRFYVKNNKWVSKK